MISFVVPVYNEEERLPLTLTNIIRATKTVNKLRFEIIVINDGSTDNTPYILDKFCKKHSFIRVIHQPKNLGLGMGIREGIKAARFPKLMVVPGDNDAPQNLLVRLIKTRNMADLVMSFYLNKEQRGVIRNILSAVYGLIYMSTFGVYVQYINGAQIYPAKKLKEFDIKSKRFSIIAELTIKTLRSGCTYYEVPGYMQTGLEGSSSFSIKNLLEIISTFLKLVYEIKVANKMQFKYKPVRIMA